MVKRVWIRYRYSEYSSLPFANIVVNVIDTTLGGYPACKTMIATAIPNTDQEGTLFQVWAKVSKYIFLLMFFGPELTAEFKNQVSRTSFKIAFSSVSVMVF
jgi:hypothetical protein